MAIDILGIVDLKQQIAKWNTTYNGVHDLKSFGEIWANDNCDVGIRNLIDIRNKASCDGGINSLDEIIGVGTYFEPVGSSFCELLSTKSFIENDLFLISRNEYDSYGNISSISSRKATYHQLSGKLAEDILDKLNLKTMAFEYKSKYAISSHLHDDIYSKCELIVNDKYKLTPENGSDISNLCYIQIDTDYIAGDQDLVYKDINKNPRESQISRTHLSINMPKIVIPLPPKPLIGTMRFIGLSSIQRIIEQNLLVLTNDGLNVNPYDENGKIRDDYDGWMFPNGGTIYNIDNQLSDASLVYTGIPNSNTITLPNISEFFKINPGTRKNESSCIYTTNYQTGLVPHFHTVDKLDIGGTLELDIENTRIRSTDARGGKINTHHARKTDEGEWSDPFEFDIDLGQIAFDPPLSTTYDGGSTEPNYPTHNIVPIMIYVGGETRNYYEGLCQTT